MYNWAIIGCGDIARRMADALIMVDEAVLYAVGSRSFEKAEKFQQEKGFLKAYGSYEELYKDDNIDIVYIATPHNYHAGCALDAMRHGKHVLIEKPMAVNSIQVKEIIACARENNVFCMEAMWMRFLPVYETVYKWIRDGHIGNVVSISASFAAKVPVDDMNCRLSNPLLAGGALLDLGVYPINFAAMFLGSTPSQIDGVASFTKAGVDMNSSISLLYENGSTASLHTGLTYTDGRQGIINGTMGMILVPHYIWGDTATLYTGEEAVDTVSFPYENGFQFEAAEIQNCIAGNKKESSLMPLSETLNITEIMDTLRRKWDFKYPFEV